MRRGEASASFKGAKARTNTWLYERVLECRRECCGAPNWPCLEVCLTAGVSVVQPILLHDAEYVG